ncbi:MAG: UvrB/UvrC motif-containing protein [Planctomycetota bacterium]|nr:UvrB/UvrC motif-containing protein [Planctomycetota bacterium]
MHCDHCSNPAVVHEIVIHNGAKTEVHLCMEHAIEKGHSIPLTQPIAALFASTMKRPAASATNAFCDVCGSTWAHFRKSGRLGCPSCYDTFGDALAAQIILAQRGSVAHGGEAPRQSSCPEGHQLLRSQLLRELDAAVGAEQYERAASIRDRLRTLTGGIDAP